MKSLSMGDVVVLLVSNREEAAIGEFQAMMRVATNINYHIHVKITSWTDTTHVDSDIAAQPIGDIEVLWLIGYVIPRDEANNSQI